MYIENYKKWIHFFLFYCAQAAPLSPKKDTDVFDYEEIKSVLWHEWILYGICGWVLLAIFILVVFILYKKLKKK